MKSSADIAFAFDYNHSGKLDDIALYRPGHGSFFHCEGWACLIRGASCSPCLVMLTVVGAVV